MMKIPLPDVQGQMRRERISTRPRRARRAEGEMPGVTVGVGMRPRPPALTPGPSPASGRGEKGVAFTLIAMA